MSSPPPAPSLDPLDTASWQAFPNTTNTTAHVLRNIPYTPNANDIQNLTIYIPTSTSPSTQNTNNDTTYWMIYIHGGAWRDPFITSTSFDAIASHLLASSSAPKIKALASINYSLSPHPSHPLPPTTTPAERESRTATHPRHKNDTRSALAFLQKSYGFGSRYVLVGHSCGATLAFQALFSDVAGEERLDAPAAIVGINGLYDLPRLVREPGRGYEPLREVYREILIGAFGGDEGGWDAVSPTRVVSGLSLTELGTVALVSSEVDELVDNEGQAMRMSDAFERVHDGPSSSAGMQRRDVWRYSIKGKHDEAWSDGRDMAEVLRQILRRIG